MRGGAVDARGSQQYWYSSETQRRRLERNSLPRQALCTSAAKTRSFTHRSVACQTYKLGVERSARSLVRSCLASGPTGSASAPT